MVSYRSDSTVEHCTRPSESSSNLSSKARLAARALPLVESLEQRRLLVTFSVNIIDNGGTYAELYDEVANTILAAGQDWGTELAADVNIEIELHFVDEPGESFLAFANSVEFEKIFEIGNVDVVELGPVHEIRTGFDPNGGIADMMVTFNAAFFDVMFFDPDPFNREVPLPPEAAFQFDAYSILLHEIGHPLGFIHLSDHFTGEPGFIDEDTDRVTITTFDLLSDLKDGQLYFTGENAINVYGKSVPLRLGNAHHYGNPAPDGPGTDLDLLLMSAEIGFGEQLFIEEIDLAILADLGLELVTPIVTTPQPILVVNGTTGPDIIKLTHTGDLIVITVNDQQTMESTLDFGQFEVNGGLGDDVILLSANMPSTTINGGDGRDTIVGGNGDDTINGGAGADALSGSRGRDRIHGEGGADKIYGADGSDRLFGGAGNDYIEGSSGNDRFFGGSGHDLLIGGASNDTMFGEGGNDTLSGGTFDDSLHGGSGADMFIGGDGRDIVDYADRATDLVLSLNAIADDGDAGEGDNLLSGIELVLGGSGNDSISGDGRNNYLIGNDGADTLNGGSGNDTLEGNAGLDVLDGSAGNDVLVGGGGRDRLVGGSDNDNLFGGKGNDLLFTRDRWADSLSGGAGFDAAELDPLDEDALVEIEETVTNPIV